MESKTLLTGIISFIAGALLVSTAAVTINKPEPAIRHDSMEAMTRQLQDKTGDEFDQAFIASMIEHHEGAVDMARLAERQAKHDEIKQLSRDIIAAQEREIIQMKRWQAKWGYEQVSNPDHDAHR